MIAIIDYGVGNLFSLCRSLEFIGQDTVVTGEPATISGSDKIILPGVGAFEDAARKLRESGLFDLIKKEAESGKPLFGICLGMQMLFEKSLEHGEHTGLGLLRGSIVSIESAIPKDNKVPHIGWNALSFPNSEKNPLFRYISEGDHVYFVHSYHAAGCDSIIATAEYGTELTAAVSRGNVCGTQFHPEKSGAVGLNILRGFCESA